MEVSARISTGAAAGFDFLNLGSIGKSLGRSVGRGIEGRLHVARRAVDAAGEVELDRDAAGAERAHRGHLGHAGDLAEAPLRGSRDRGRHGLGVGAGPAGVTR